MRPQTAAALLAKSSAPLKIGCAILDGFLGGGLREGITELTGESATGKTQWALQLLLQAQLPIQHGGLGGSAVIISTEGELPMDRLKQMEKAMKKKHPWSEKNDYLNKIYIRQAEDVDEAMEVVSRLPHLIQHMNVKLIIIDSIAAIFRVEFDHTQARERSKKLFNLAAQLKTICSKHSIPCVVINQVSDLFEPEIQRPSSSSTYNRFAGPAYTHTHENASASASSVSSSASSPSLSPHANTLNHKRVSAKNNKYANPSPEFTCDMKRWSVVSSGRRVVPTLGITWAACINTRLFLSRNTVYNTASTSHMYSHAQTHGNGDGSNSTQSASTYQNTSRTNSSDNYNDSSSRGSSSTYSNSNSNNDNNNNNNVLNKNGTPTHESAHSAHIDRKIHVIFSSHLSPGSCSFVVGADGVQGMNQ